MNNKKTEKWRIAIFVIAVLFIIFMWVKKDIGKVAETVPSDQLVPVVVTSLAVSILKFALIAGVVFLVKWLVNKRNK
ncbi:MAG: hypothetical protein J6S23_07550 [Clostridia bacterium]|nr:hypothetical protein [Clostridia bacterium]